MGQYEFPNPEWSDVSQEGENPQTDRSESVSLAGIPSSGKFEQIFRLNCAWLL